MELNPTVLVFSPVASHPPHRGNRQRILQMASLFRDCGFRIDLAIGRNRTITPEARAFWSDIHVLKHVPRWRPTRRTVPFDAWYTPGLGEELAEIVKKSGADIVLFNYIFHTKALEFLPKSIFSILDTHDVFAGRASLHKSRKYSGGFFSCSPEDEKKYLNRANAVVAISADDARTFSERGVSRPIFNLPFSKRTVSQRETNAPTNNTSQGAKRTLTFGMMLSANDLNLASLYEFISSVDKHYGQSPPFQVVIAGDIRNLAYRYFPHRGKRFKRDWVSYLGEVESLDAFYSSVDAAIIPITEGTGMAVKFVEGLAQRVPVISTSAGSRGSNATHPLHLLPSVQSLAVEIGTLEDDKLRELMAVGTELSLELEARVLSELGNLLRHATGSPL